MINSCLIQLIVCPHCRATLNEDDNKLACSKCNRTYPVRRGIPDFRQKDDYWCNVSREKMKHLNRRAEESGDWLNSAKEIIPEYADHFVPFYRADSQFLWPTTENSRILDAGCMWGGLTIPAAQFHREVYAVDKTVETLEFLKIRAKQMGFENIHTFAAFIKSLPFSDNFFDLVILNGVLEWVGLEEDVILEKHWKGKRNGKHVYPKTPEEMQIDVLKELHRVLKPEGSLYIAMENRYGIQYFIGHPDDHNNVRFVTFLPRFFADKISRIVGKGGYRTYIYSPKQLVNILKKSGFESCSIYGVFPHYIKIKKAFPLGMASLFKNEVQIDGVFPRILHKIVKSLIPKSITQHVTPSLFAICAKNNQNELIPRIQNSLIKVNVLKRSDNVNFVISNNRYKNRNSTNMIIYDYNNYPLYFCKIAREVKISGLRTETENMKWLSDKMLMNKNLNFRIPKFIFSETVDGLEIFVTTFLGAKNIKLTSHYIINKGFDRIGINNRFFRKSIGFAEEKVFLKKIDGKIKQAINTLVEFQQSTSNGKSNMKNIVNEVVNKYFKCQRNISDEIRRNILELKDKTRIMSEIDILTCSVHGDYDFDNVLFFADGRVGLIDFEHLEKDGSPFFDLATLIFNPLIMKWQSSYLRNESFDSYLNEYGAIKYVVKWLKYFCDEQQISSSIIPMIPLIAAVEQNIKSYPLFRDPNTYPMYGEDMLKEFFSINIDRNY